MIILLTTVKLGYTVMRGAEYCCNINESCSEEYSVMVNSKEVLGTSENLTLYTR
jgi:hypothetical protein